MKWGFQIGGVQITLIDTTGLKDLTLMEESDDLYERGLELLRQRDEEGADNRVAVREVGSRLRAIRDELAERGYYAVKRLDFQTGDVYVDFVHNDDIEDEEEYVFLEREYGDEDEDEEEEEHTDKGPGRDIIICGDEEGER